jgi:hypothetical protein
MHTHQSPVQQDATPFLFAPYSSSSTGADGTLPALPTPLLDPQSLETAQIAYDTAIEELRQRNKSSLRPAVRHMLANRILSFAIFGERDPRSLADRALAHFG